ncbi:MAG TPA: aldehyde dehydrogenase family protein, partial [Candidatus Limnocylindrales bacterium]
MRHPRPRAGVERLPRGLHCARDVGLLGLRDPEEQLLRAGLSYDKLFIGGEWVAPSSSRTIEVFSASTEEPIGRVPEAVDADVESAVVAARTAFQDPTGWATREPSARADAIMARRVSAQNGMPISIATMHEAAFPQVVLRYYAGLIRSAVLDETRDGLLGGKVQVRRTLVGVVGGIAPWNYPVTLATFKLGPALAM